MHSGADARKPRTCPGTAPKLCSTLYVSRLTPSEFAFR
nr:MAG TPA: hypothetical protein [Caudoviricetes sp.]